VTVAAGRGLEGEPSGGVVGINFGDWQMEGSLGVYNGSIVGGANASANINQHWSVTAGDQRLELAIPTNRYMDTYVMARGASVSYTPTAATTVTLFGGMAGGGGAFPLTSFFTPKIPLGGISIDHYLDSKKRILLFSRALFSNQQTILGGIAYQTKRLRTGIAAGTGSNQPHAEGLLNYVDKQWDIREQYLYSGSRFQLLTMPQLRLIPEDRENLDVRWSPWKLGSFSVGRHEYLNLTDSGIGSRGTTDSGGAAFFLRGMGFGGNVFESNYVGVYSSATSFFASQNLPHGVRVNENYYLPLHAVSPLSVLVINVDEKLNRRLQISQYVSHTNGRWSVNYGGGLHWDSADVSVGYVTNYIPLLARGGQFQQAMSVSGHVNLGRWSVGVHSIVQPDGSVIYAYDIRSYFLHQGNHRNLQSPMSRSRAELPNFLITGLVELEGTGLPVPDVPVRVRDNTVYTDEKGVFSLHVARQRSYKTQVLLEDLIGDHYYDLVSGPTEAMAGTEAAPGEATFVVRVSQRHVGNAPHRSIVIGGPIATEVAPSNPEH